MDAISDVSRSSEIFSSVPARPPLTDPLDLDTLFGFNDFLSSREQGELSEEWKYFDRSKIFINHVDSFTSKYLVKILTSKDQRESNLDQRCQGVTAENEFVEIKHGTKEGPREKGTKGIKGGGSMKSKGSIKGKKKKGEGNERKSKSPSPMRSLEDKLLENLDNILNDEENHLHDTSKLTVSEYYEMMDLESNEERETFLKEKLSKFVEVTNTDFDREVSTVKKVAPKDIANDYKIIGTSIFNDNVPYGVSEIVKGPMEDSSFVEQIVKCGIIIYIVNEDKEQVSEATMVFNSVLNYIDNLKEREEPNQFQLPLFILVSSFMTWAFTKPLSPEEPDLPFIEKDYRKRKPHKNYQMLYELEEHVIKAQNNGEIEAAVIVSGIPYGHEEFTFRYFFESAFKLVDLPIYNCGDNNIPVVHVENLAKIVKEVLIRRRDINSPFIFAKDQVNYSLKNVIKAISTSLGTGCYKVVPDAWAFLTDEITQDVFDQITSNISLESCYPLFKRSDIKWKYESGFGTDIQNVIKEFIAAYNLKPLKIVVYGTSSTHTTDIASELSKIYRAPYISLDNVLNEYFVTMQEQVKHMEEVTPSVLKKDLKSKDDSDVLLLSDTTVLTECASSNNITTQLEYFKKLNLKRPSDVKSLTETQKTSIIRNKLLTDRSCLNHGYILNEFPLSLVQARLLYQANNILGNDCDETVSLPGYVIFLKRVEASLAQLPSDVSQELLYKDYRPSRLSWYKEEPQSVTEEENDSTDVAEENENNKTDILMDSLILNVEKPVISFLLDENPACKYIEIEVNMENTEPVLRQILEFIEGGDVSVDSIKKAKCIENNIEEKEEEVTVKDKSDFKNLLTPEESLSKFKESEEVVLAVRSCPLIRYLINYIYPTLTNAILELCEIRPDDPLDFLAEYLFRHNPDGRMPDPGESTIIDEGFPNQDNVPRACHSLFLFNTAKS